MADKGKGSLSSPGGLSYDMLISSGVRFEIETTQCLADLNLTLDMAVEIIGSLDEGCYVNGPSPDDHDSAREVWVFGSTIDFSEIYIKLTLRRHPQKRNVFYLLIWSFHVAR